MKEASRLRLEGISVSFAKLQVLDQVSLTIQAGQIHGLIGPNGAGKSTLLNVATGFVPASAGRVRFGDNDVTRRSSEWRARAGVVRTFQAARIFNDLTVVENIRVAASVTANAAASARTTARLIDEFGLADVQDVRGSELAYGYERRLSIARALATNPRFLLLDEPAAGLDEDETKELGRELLRIRDDRNLGVVLVEHDVELVMTVSDEVHVLAEGRNLASGTPKSVVADQAVRAAYLGEKGVTHA
jgi:branched-chain amino acid transport system ATP-binding protein